MPTEVKGALALRKALRDFEPDLAKETTKEISSFLKPVARQARGFLPSNEEAPSGFLKLPNAKGRWADRYYDKAEASRGISYKTSPSKENRRGWVALASIRSKNAGAAIYETAGRKSGIVGNFTPRFTETLEGNGRKMTGRAMFKAFAKDQGKATAGVVQAIQKAEAKFKGKTR
jgi:hypothetical protein